MIERLTLLDFQCHERLTLELSPTVTTIVGRTDSGKSAILRAKRWIALNTPQGASFIRAGAKSCKGILSVDGRKVKRARGSAGNTYSLDGKTYQAFRNDVPQEIADVLKLTELNFARQHDPPFWLLLSAPEVSRQLNSVVDLGAIDNALSSVAAAVRHAEQEVESTSSRLTQAKADVEKLYYVSQLSSELEQLECQNDRLQTLRQKRLLLTRSLEDIALLAETVDRVSATGLDGFSTVSDVAESLQSVRERREGLETLLGSIEEAYTECQQLESTLGDVSTELTTLSQGRCPLCGSSPS